VNTFYFANPRSVACLLDPKRARKQLVENIQIGKALTGYAGAWANHPAVKMWSGCTLQFGWYWEEFIDGVRGRGLYSNEVGSLAKSTEEMIKFLRATKDKETMDWWWRNDEFVQLSHKSSLLRKDKDYYTGIFEKGIPDIGYFWPLPEKDHYMYMYSGKPKTRQFLTNREDCLALINKHTKEVEAK
jgi:hypothetical protein